MELLFWCALLLGIFCIGYYIVIILYAGIGVNFAWIWCVGGTGCLGACMILRFILYKHILIPGWLLTLLCGLIVLVILAFLTIEGMLLFGTHHKAGKNMDYLLVLGSQINGNQVTKNLKNRLDTAISYLNENPYTEVVVTGGRGAEGLISEAAAMKAYLIDQGISSSRILTEDQSNNTIENMIFSKKLLRENSTVVIVTNNFHIYRSTRLAKKQGIVKVYTLIAPTDRLMILHYYVREAAGVGKDKLLGNL
ncbi:MAG: hypothetical protein K0R46_1685 [Herbinix sp.]|nr:hypothetical protein [Herbinix sp.]